MPLKQDPARIDRVGDFSEPGLSREVRIETDDTRITLDTGRAGGPHPRVDSPRDQSDLEERERQGEQVDEASKSVMEELP